MKVTHLRVREVVEIITHPANQKIPVYYKRVFTEKTARFEKSGFDRAVPGGLRRQQAPARPLLPRLALRGCPPSTRQALGAAEGAESPRAASTTSR